MTAGLPRPWNCGACTPHTAPQVWDLFCLYIGADAQQAVSHKHSLHESTTLDLGPEHSGSLMRGVGAQGKQSDALAQHTFIPSRLGLAATRLLPLCLGLAMFTVILDMPGPAMGRLAWSACTCTAEFSRRYELQVWYDAASLHQLSPHIMQQPCRLGPGQRLACLAQRAAGLCIDACRHSLLTMLRAAHPSKCRVAGGWVLISAAGWGSLHPSPQGEHALPDMHAAMLLSWGLARPGAGHGSCIAARAHLVRDLRQ